MSDLTQCNYCSLQQIRAKAKHDRMKVTIMPGRTFGAGMNHMRGLDVYVHPRKVDVRKLSARDREKYWNRWFWELTDHCAC